MCFTITLTDARFRWVTCQLDYLCGFSSDFERRRALGQLPPTLHETYLRLLRKFSAMPPSTQSKIEMCLHFIAFSPTRLTISQLRSAISTPEIIGSCLDADNMVSEEDIAFMCGSLVRKTDNGDFFEFAHFSVREFLEHESLARIPDLERYQISRQRSNEMLVSQCLRFLQLSNFDIDIADPESLVNFTEQAINTQGNAGIGFHVLAARLSLQLYRERQLDSMSPTLMKSLFQPHKPSSLLLLATLLCFELISCCGSTGLAQSSDGGPHLELAKKLMREEFRPIHLAAALNLPDVCRHLIDVGSDLEVNSPFGTPFELSITSFLRLIFHACDPALIEKHHHHLRRPIHALLGKNHERNETFEIFECTHLEQLAKSSTGQSRDIVVLGQALIIAFAENNFWIPQKLLSQGMTLDHTIYTRLFPDLMSQSLAEIQANEEPLLSFLQYIGSRLVAESGWPLEIGRLIWRTAVELELLFTRDSTVTDFRISLSKDALVSRAFATIKSHDMEGLQECLADGRLDISERHRDPQESHDADDPMHLTLIHFAVLENNLQATKALAQAGCDPNIPSVQLHYKCPPIHDCSRIDIFEELLAHGASATDVEVHTGENMWHLYGSTLEPETDFYDCVAKRFPSETAKALLMRSKDGNTPLQHLLISGSSSKSHEDHVDRVIALIEICHGILNFWSRHDPMFGVAAVSGSERVIRRLIEVGVPPETIGPGTETPLHRISVESSPASVQCLKELVPAALTIRFEGQLPLQAYIQKCLGDQHPIDDAVAHQLSTAESLESIDGKGTTLWEYYCNIHTADTGIPNQSINATLWSWLLRRDSAMHVYEKTRGRSGLVLLLSRLTRLDEMEDLVSIIPLPAFSHAIDSTDCWQEVKSDSDILRFLQFSIKKQAYPLVSVLIERGVSVHDQVDGYSSIQVSFRSPLALSLCSDEQGKDMLIEMLDQVTPENLNDYDRNGLTILHNLATTGPGSDAGLRWLIRTLVNKGVDLDKVGRLRDQGTPITYHLRKGSVSGATYLLELGADPELAQIDGGGNATQEACLRGSITFLRDVFDYSKKTGVQVDWKRKGGLWSRSGPFIHGVTAIHYASTVGSLEVLELLVDNGLIDDLEIPSDEGWTAMHCAARSGHALAIEYLASKGCGTMPETDDKTTPLHLSVREQQYEATKSLIRLGAKDVPDVTGMTPTMYASRSNNKSMLQLLGEFLGPETSLAQDLARDSLPRKRLRALSTAMEQAIQSDDIQECKRLVAIGCPVNISIRGWSPLILALHQVRLDIAEWLLDNGAMTTGRIFHDAMETQYYNAVEICLAHPELCKLLPSLIDLCIQDGSGWPFLDDRSTLTAIRAKNTEGLSILLKLLNEKAVMIR